jgi:hypothetical protein
MVTNKKWMVSHMKIEEIKATFDRLAESLQEMDARKIERKLENATERLAEIETQEEEHKRGMRNNDSYYTFAPTTKAEDALWTYHNESYNELQEEKLELKLLLAIAPLLLED